MKLKIQLFFLLFIVNTSIFSQNMVVTNDVLTDLSYRNQAEVLITFKTNKAILKDGYDKKWSKLKKTTFVYEKLIQITKNSQRECIQYLEENNKDYQSFWIANCIKTDISNSDLSYLKKQKNIVSISSNKPTKTVTSPQILKDKQVLRLEENWGIQNIQANLVWEKGIKGQGVVVAGQDTGYDWKHEAIISSYRGSITEDTTHQYNWHDAIHEAINNPCGTDTSEPCDDLNHGTHTMGTVASDNSINLIGIAPESKWIGCRNMDRGNGTPSTYIECFQWFLAPTDLNGENPKPEMAPDVINNSWGCPESEGCNPDNWSMMETVVDNLKLGGIFVVLSAGNDGPGCSSISKAPSIFNSPTAVGAIQRNDTITYFSSRGPVVVQADTIIKPDVAAPGSGIYSCIRNNQYAYYSGTSMAGPHLTGMIALMISADPSLKGQVDSLEFIVKHTARKMDYYEDCGNFLGTDYPNIAYGYGNIDALNAINFILPLVGTNDHISNGNFKIIPNPAKGEISIESTDIIDQVEIFSVNGVAKLKTNSISKINISKLAKGIYFVQIRSKNGITTEKLIVK